MVKFILLCAAWMALSGKNRDDKAKYNIAEEIMNRKRRR